VITSTKTAKSVDLDVTIKNQIPNIPHLTPNRNVKAILENKNLNKYKKKAQAIDLSLTPMQL
jgi:hypothetical protein